MAVNVTSSTRDTKELNPLVQILLNAALLDAKKNGVNPLIVETFRPQERQYYLYGQGRTVYQCTNAGMPKKYAEKYARKGTQVTWTLKSIHTKRCAVDVVPQRKQKNGVLTAIWNASDKDTIQLIKSMEKYGFEAGANWHSSPDSPHFQVDGVDPNGKYFKSSNTNKYITTLIQKALKKAGYYNGYAIDGKWGKATSNAIKKFKVVFGMKNNDLVGEKTLKNLLKYV